MPIRGILLILLIAIAYGVIFRNQLVAWWNGMKTTEDKGNNTEEDEK